MSRVVILFVLLLWCGHAIAADAHADELSPERRQNAEHAFLDGRLGDLDTLMQGATTPTDRFPLVLQRHWWRRSVGFNELVEPPHPPKGSGGAADPYPLLIALIEDRVRRETRGAEGLPEDGPLATYLANHPGGRTEQEADVVLFSMDMMIRSYRGDDDPAEEFRKDRAARKLYEQNRLIYLTSLGALLVLAFIGILVVGRPRT